MSIFFLKKVYRLPVIFLCLVVFQGCAQKIAYKLGDISPSPNEVLKKYSLSIENFNDIRPTIPENRILFNRGRAIKFKDGENKESRFQGKRVYMNSEEEYEPWVTSQVAEIMAKHGNKRGAFNSVLVSSKQAADFHLVGELRRFYGIQRFSIGANIAAQFGLFGAVATLGMTSDGEIRVAFSNLKIFTRDGKLVKDLGELVEDYDGKCPVDGYGWSIYANVNARLKKATDKLMKQVEIAVAEYASPK